MERGTTLWSSDDPRSEGDSTSDGLGGHRSDPLSSTMIRFLSGFVRNTIRFDPRWGGPPPLGFVSDGWPPPGDRIPLHKTILIGGYPGNAVLKFGSKTTALDEEIVPPLTRGTRSPVHPAFNAPLSTPSSSDSHRGTSSQRGGIPHRQFRRFPVRWSLSSFRVSKGERFPFEPERSGSTVRK